jgi:hypothetical protein
MSGGGMSRNTLACGFCILTTDGHGYSRIKKLMDRFGGEPLNQGSWSTTILD